MTLGRGPDRRQLLATAAQDALCAYQDRMQAALQARDHYLAANDLLFTEAGWRLEAHELDRETRTVLQMGRGVEFWFREPAEPNGQPV